MKLDDLTKLLRPLRMALSNMVSRAVLQLVDDSKKMQLVQLGVLDGETRTEVERFQNYGFSSVPLEGAEAVVVFVGGRRDHALCVAVDDRSVRLTGLQSGEVAMFDHNGSSVVMKANGDIIVSPHSGRVVLNATDVELAGNSDAAARASLVDARLADIVSWLNSHVHTSAAPGSPTSTPAVPIGSEASVASTKVKLS